MVLAAVAAGATAAAKDTASQAVRDAYAGLKALVNKRFEKKPQAEMALAEYEGAHRADPSSAYALGNIASLSWYLGKLDKARKYYMLTELASTDRSMTTHTEVY